MRSGLASPASNGGRGLKHLFGDVILVEINASPASNGGRGLKRAHGHHAQAGAAGIARQQWRARIETARVETWGAKNEASPASNGGRGLKLPGARRRPRPGAHRPPAMAGAD